MRDISNQPKPIKINGKFLITKYDEFINSLVSIEQECDSNIRIKVCTFDEFENWGKF